MARLPFLLLSLIITTQAFAQTEDIVIGQIHKLSSTILNEERSIAISTPQDYLDSEEKYQVLYVLDGEWNLAFVSSLVDKLVSSGDLPPMIVVGIINNNRNKDLTPAGTNDNPHRFGGGELFLRFITEELQPWVDGNFRTQPYRVLAGHSFGGLFTIFSMMKAPGAFDAYMALSPSLGRNNEQQVRIAKEYFSTENPLPNDLYIAVGNEGGATYASTKNFMEVLDTHAKHSFNYHFDHLTEESHVSISAQGFMEGLKFLYKDYNPERQPGLDEIFMMEAHYQTLSKKYGYTLTIPETYYQQFVKEQIGERELDYALYILEKYQTDYPNSPYLLSYCADVYLLQGKFEEAKTYYLKLKNLGVENEALGAILANMKD